MSCQKCGNSTDYNSNYGCSDCTSRSRSRSRSRSSSRSRSRSRSSSSCSFEDYSCRAYCKVITVRPVRKFCCEDRCECEEDPFVWGVKKCKDKRKQHKGEFVKDAKIKLKRGIIYKFYIENDNCYGRPGFYISSDPLGNCVVKGPKDCGFLKVKFPKCDCRHRCDCQKCYYFQSTHGELRGGQIKVVRGRRNKYKDVKI